MLDPDSGVRCDQDFGTGSPIGGSIVENNDIVVDHII
jgi:hypothetical protein